MKTEVENAAVENERWTLLRNVLVFQCKLVVDGFRDLVLLPVSLIAGLVSLLHKGPHPGPEFHDLLRLGKRSERWINLFGAAEGEEAPLPEDDKLAARGFDELVARLESFLVDEYRKGGITAQAKQRLDAALDSLRGARARLGRRQ